MGALQFGPLALAADRLIAVIALWGFVALVSFGRRWVDGDPVRPAVMAITLGIGAARLGFVFENWEAFAPEPWTAAYLWQGGFSSIYGLAIGALVLAGMLRGRVRALALASAITISSAWFLADHVAKVPPKPLPTSLTVSQLDGAALSLDDLQGQPFVINLWATWCGPCQREMPMLVKFAREHPDIPVLLVNQGEDAESIAAYLLREGLPEENILMDERADVGRKLGSSALPTTAFVSANGMVTGLQVGEISRAALMAAINDLQRAVAKGTEH